MTKTYAKPLNLWSWWLTGRSTGFDEPALNLASPPGQSDEPPALARVRRHLGLDSGRAYYLRPLLAAMTTVPEMLQRVPRSVELSLFQSALSVAPAGSHGAQIVAASSAAGARYDYHPVMLPAPFIWSLWYFDNQLAELRNDAGGRWVLTYRKSAGRLMVDWPSGFGWLFHLIPVTPWEAGSRISLALPPRSYPYQQVLSWAGADSDAVELMERSQCLEGFLNLTTATRRLGMLAWAIALEALRVDHPLMRESATTHAIPEDPEYWIIQVDGSDIHVDGAVLTVEPTYWIVQMDGSDIHVDDLALTLDK